MGENRILKKPTLHFVQEVTGREGERKVYELGLEEIDLENTQFEYRLDPGIELLMESIRRDGQQIPVILRGKRPPYQLVCGFRRVRTIRAIGEKRVKAYILPDLGDVEAHRLSVLENEERKSLTDLDRANACRKFYEGGMTQEEVAETLGCSRVKVSRYLSLLKVGPQIFEALRTGRIMSMHALLLQQVSAGFTEEQLEVFIGQIEKKELSTRELERMIRRAGKRGGAAAPRGEFFKETAEGFRLSGICYRRDMPDDEKEKMAAALKKALQLLTDKEANDG